MRAEKQLLAREYVARLNASPFAVVVDYQGLTVRQFTQLRSQLRTEGAEVHVVKNSILRLAARDAGLPDLGPLSGQLAVVTGQKDISTAAKVLRKSQKSSDKPKFKFGFLNNERLDADALLALADLPSMDVLRATLLGLLQAPASKLVRLLNTPASQLAQVLQAFVDKTAQPAAAG